MPVSTSATWSKGDGSPSMGAVSTRNTSPIHQSFDCVDFASWLAQTMTTSPACTDTTEGRFDLAVALPVGVMPDGTFTPPMPIPPCISTSVLSVVRLVVNGLHLHTIHGQGMDMEGRAKSLNLNGHGLFAADRRRLRICESRQAPPGAAQKLTVGDVRPWTSPEQLGINQALSTKKPPHI